MAMFIPGNTPREAVRVRILEEGCRIWTFSQSQNVELLAHRFTRVESTSKSLDYIAIVIQVRVGFHTDAYASFNALFVVFVTFFGGKKKVPECQNKCQFLKTAVLLIFYFRCFLAFV